MGIYDPVWLEDITNQYNTYQTIFTSMVTQFQTYRKSQIARTYNNLGKGQYQVMC